MTHSLVKFFLFGALTLTLITSCGPSKEEQEREIKKEDSLANIQSNEALDRANQLFESDSIKDTIQSSK